MTFYNMLMLQKHYVLFRIIQKNLEVKQMDGYYSSLKGKRALVTGGAGILAQAMVAGLAQAGADTAAIDCSDHVYTTASLARSPLPGRNQTACRPASSGYRLGRR